MSLEALYGPAGAEAIRYLRRPQMGDARFALIRKPTDPHDKPVVFESLPDLVAAIHRDRRGDTIHTLDARIQVRGEDTSRQGVGIWAINKAEQARYLGWAYLDGRKSAALARALEACCPQLPIIGKAA